MRTVRRALLLALPLTLVGLGLVAVDLASSSTATSQTGATPTGAAPAPITIDTVLVADPGNAPDPVTGYGSVATTFRMGTYEVTIAQYTAFLNAVARVPDNATIRDLFKEEMADATEDPGALIERTGAGTAQDPYVYTPSTSAAWPDAARRPVPWVTWFDAARFANWMHNGQGRGGTETGAYTLVDFQQAGIAARNPGARFWIPSEDEWYKAAYYDPTKPGAAKYWAYPTTSDRPPRIARVSDRPAAPAANFQNVYKKSGQGVLTPVGSYPDSTSHYGTLDQGGNLWEWTEAAYPDPTRGPNRIVRGGSWGPGITPLERTVRRDYGPMGTSPFYSDDDAGFRLATLP